MKATCTIIACLLMFTAAFAGEPPDTDIHELVTPAPITPPNEFPRLVAASRNMVVPVPAKTPFDADRGDRRAYLRAYRAAYRFTAATGWVSTCCLVAGTLHREATIDGHYAGQQAAIRTR